MKILNKNGLPYSRRVLFAPGVVILPIVLDLRFVYYTIIVDIFRHCYLVLLVFNYKRFRSKYL